MLYSAVFLYDVANYGAIPWRIALFSYILSSIAMQFLRQHMPEVELFVPIPNPTDSLADAQHLLSLHFHDRMTSLP